MIKKIALALLVVLVLLQFYRPEKNISSVVADTDLIASVQPADEVAAILKDACYDCHSNNTTYPWYAEIAPVSLWIDHHVQDGKKHLNFSEWTTYSNKKKAHKLEEVAEELEKGGMPLKSYTLLHENSRLTPEQVEMLSSWAMTLRATYPVEE